MSFLDFLKKTAIFFVKIYQKTISFDHGPMKFLYTHGFCKFFPTCSQYTIEAISRLGLLKGGFWACRRVLRCHPWSKGGVDEIPEKK
jgi:putative membrane protein insertion efficiency factor